VRLQEWVEVKSLQPGRHHVYSDSRTGNRRAVGDFDGGSGQGDGDVFMLRPETSF